MLLQRILKEAGHNEKNLECHVSSAFTGPTRMLWQPISDCIHFFSFFLFFYYMALLLSSPLSDTKTWSSRSFRSWASKHLPFPKWFTWSVIIPLEKQKRIFGSRKDAYAWVSLQKPHLLSFMHSDSDQLIFYSIFTINTVTTLKFYWNILL